MFAFRYPELRINRTGEPWSIRQTAIYNLVDLKQESTIWMMFHPTYNSKADVLLQAALKDGSDCQALARQPVRQFLIPVMAYFSNWREYMLHFDNELLLIVSLGLERSTRALTKYSSEPS